MDTNIHDRIMRLIDSLVPDPNQGPFFESMAEPSPEPATPLEELFTHTPLLTEESYYTHPSPPRELHIPLTFVMYIHISNPPLAVEFQHTLVLRLD